MFKKALEHKNSVNSLKILFIDLFMLKKYGLVYGSVLECLSSMPGFIPSTHTRTHPHTERVGERGKGEHLRFPLTITFFVNSKFLS